MCPWRSEKNFWELALWICVVESAIWISGIEFRWLGLAIKSCIRRAISLAHKTIFMLMGGMELGRGVVAGGGWAKSDWSRVTEATLVPGVHVLPFARAACIVNCWAISSASYPIRHILCIHSSGCGHLHCFHLWTTVNNDSMNIHVQISLHIPASLAFKFTPTDEVLHFLVKSTRVFLILRVSLGI